MRCIYPLPRSANVSMYASNPCIPLFDFLRWLQTCIFFGNLGKYGTDRPRKEASVSSIILRGFSVCFYMFHNMFITLFSVQLSDTECHNFPISPEI